MSKRARSARGEIIDFDLLAIKQQLAVTPVPVGVDQRRKFIDEKDGIKTKAALPEALMMAVEAVEENEAASIEPADLIITEIVEEVVEPVVAKSSKKTASV
jgi:predicted solute-binding protein